MQDPNQFVPYSNHLEMPTAIHTPNFAEPKVAPVDSITSTC